MLGMEKQSFLIYLGVGFLMTLGVWGLMGGCSSDETKQNQASLQEEPILEKDLAIPEPEKKLIEPKEEPLPKVVEKVEEIQPAPAKQKATASKAVPKPRMVEEVKVITYVVSKGDTLWGLSRRYGMIVEEIMELNKLTDMNLRIGQKLKLKTKVLVRKDPLPTPKVHVSKPRKKKEVVSFPPVKKEKVAAVPKKKEPAVASQPEPVKEAKAAPEKEEAKRIETVKADPVPEVKPVPLVPAAEKQVEKKAAKIEEGPTMESFTGELLTHEVDQGDTIVSIAEQYQTTIPFLQDINGLTEKSQLHAGQILLVPEK